MTKPLVHLMFSPSARMSLRACLARDGRSERVVATGDDLSLGPVRDPSPPSRSRWVEEELGVTGWEEVAEDNARLVEAARSEEISPVIWYSNRSAKEYTGFLWLVSQIGDRPFSAIDVSSRLRDGKPAASTGGLPEADLRQLYGTQSTPSDSELETYRSIWARLQNEDAPLRVLESPGVLKSASLDDFDDKLMSNTTDEWRKMAHIVGETMRTVWENGLDSPSDLLLSARIHELAEAGRIETRGEPFHMQRSEFRRRAE